MLVNSFKVLLLNVIRNMIISKRLIFVTLILLQISISCNVKNDVKAKEYSFTFLDENENLIENLTSKLLASDSIDKVIIFSTKPGSHILNISCNNCTHFLTNDEKMNIADYIDAMDIKYVKFKKTEFVEIALPIRDNEFKYYCIKKYFNNHTKIENEIFLKDKWYLTSD